MAPKSRKLTCNGECLDRSRSCCSVLSTDACFWKFWREFEGPQSASAMLMAVQFSQIYQVYKSIGEATES